MRAWSAGLALCGPRRHVIFGWLQVDEIVDLGPDGSSALARFPWLERHPHVRPDWSRSNAIFLAKQFLSIGGSTKPGFGVFDHPIPRSPAKYGRLGQRLFLLYPVSAEFLAEAVYTAMARTRTYVMLAEAASSPPAL
jgi:hypothetical protein